MENYLNLSENLLNRLNRDYEDNLIKLNVGNNIKRKTNLTMSDSCENNISIMISEILKSKKYKYIIDAYFSCKANKTTKLYRPDITIIDGNEIVGMLEIKAQMGYSGPQSPDDYNKKLDTFLKSEITTKYDDLHKAKCLEETIQFWNSFENNDKKNNKISFTISPDANYYVLTVLSKNHCHNVEETIENFEKYKNKYNKIHFYALYNENVWYDSLLETNAHQIFEYGTNTAIDSKIKELYGFKKFVEDIKNNLK